MGIVISDCDQNSLDWYKLRCGIPTASMFSAILAKGEGKTRRSYLNKLAAEIITGEPLEMFTSAAMERGHVMEPDARNLYAFVADIEPQRVGFVRNGPKGCSPDSLLGQDGILEIKTQRGDLLIDTLLKDEFPREHIAQCQGALWVTERAWLDIAVYWPGLPLFIKRATRDEKYIATLTSEVDRFVDELNETVEKIRRYGVQRMENAA